MPDDMRDTVEDAARRVYEELRGGYKENVYRQALAVEFRDLGIEYQTEHTREVFYKKQRVGEQRLDFLVLGNDDLVIELKAIGSLGNDHRAQLKAYLRNLGKKSGMLINFPNEGNEPEFETVDV